MLQAVGHERRILTEASSAELAEAGTPQLARALMAQRTTPPPRLPETDAPAGDGQLSQEW